MKTAMFGGSFNPIHTGHVQLAHAFLEKPGLDRVIIMPSYVSPHKQTDFSVRPEQKLEMCRLAFEGEELFEVSDIEIKRQGSSFTYLTLEELSERYPDDELYLITGADMFMTIHQWKCPERIFELAVICGVPRNDDDIAVLSAQKEYLDSLGARTEIFDAGVMTVSSTEIRERVRDGRSISGLVPEKVEEYIKANSLYREKRKEVNS